MAIQLNKKAVDQLMDELIKDYKKPSDALGENGILKQLSKALLERLLKEELTDHLGYPPQGERDESQKNSRNGYTSKTLKTKDGELELEMPRDRDSSFEPQAVKKHQRRFEGFDEKIISMYSRGMSTRDIQDHLKDIYGTEVSPELISNVTHGVIEEVKIWQNRALEAIYPIVYMDAIHIKVRDNGHVKNKAVYLALAVTMEGQKELLGIWMAQEEGAKFWLSVVNELKNRGVKDIFIACVDGLKGFPEAIASVYPQTQVQLCIVHMVRYSMKFVSYKDRKNLAADLKKIYTAPTPSFAEDSLDQFAEKWDKKYPSVSESWRKNWAGLIPFLAYPDYIRKAIYTTNAIESMNDQLKKITKTKKLFPNDESVMKLLYLGIRNISRKWTMPIREWGQALNQFSILFSDRMPERI